jgi:hypothetical protein
MRPVVVLAAGIALLAVAAAVVLAESKPRPAGSNYVPLQGPAVELQGRDEHCQEEGLVPADAAVMRFVTGTGFRPTPRIRVTMSTREGALLSAGTLPAGQSQGPVSVPLDRPIEETAGGIVACVATGPGAGPGRATVLYGIPGRVRFEWLRQGEESWFELLPTVAHRFGLGKGLWIGHWLFPLTVLVALGCWALGLRVLSRELAR